MNRLVRMGSLLFFLAAPTGVALIETGPVVARFEICDDMILLRMLSALEIYESHLGASHPATGMVQYALANAVSGLGDPRAAIRRYELALEAWERTLGAEHPRVAMVQRDLRRVRSSL